MMDAWAEHCEEKSRRTTGARAVKRLPFRFTFGGNLIPPKWMTLPRAPLGVFFPECPLLRFDRDAWKRPRGPHDDEPPEGLSLPERAAWRSAREAEARRWNLWDWVGRLYSA